MLECVAAPVALTRAVRNNNGSLARGGVEWSSLSSWCRVEEFTTFLAQDKAALASKSTSMLYLFYCVLVHTVVKVYVGGDVEPFVELQKFKRSLHRHVRRFSEPGRLVKIFVQLYGGIFGTKFM
jgi:hypothetical protein